jgi:hypothetical protein
MAGAISSSGLQEREASFINSQKTISAAVEGLLPHTHTQYLDVIIRIGERFGGA